MLKAVGLCQSTPVLPSSSSTQTQDKKPLQLFRSSSLSFTEVTNITVPIAGDKEGARFNLHHACMIGDDDMTRSILNSGINPNLQDVRGYTALHYACKTGQLSCMSHLLCHSEDPIALLQVPSNDGTTALSMRSATFGETLLHLACKWKDKFVLQVLLEAGADPNAKDNSGLTPLMILVLSGVMSSSTSELVNALHSHGCNLNAALEVNETNLELQPWNGWTALHMAMGKQLENVDSDCIRSLISCGASMQATDVQGRTPLHIAFIVGYSDNLDLIAPNKDYFQVKDDSGCMPLYYVCRYGHCEYFKKVLSHSPKNLLQTVNTDGATPLTVVDERGRTILHHACREGYDDVTIDLLEADADPSFQDSQGYTPLHYACENGHDKCIQAIFYSSMDPSGLSEMKDANGRIPLHIVCMQQHYHLIKALEPSHEHYLIEDNDGYTPLYYICKQGDCIRLTEICDLSEETPAISSLLAAEVTADGATPLTIVDQEGRAIIHHVCKKGDEDLTLHLLKVGADPTVQDSQGYTPLHYACEGGHIKCLNYLLYFSQNPAECLNIINNHGTSALHMQILAGDQRILHLVCERKDICVIKRLLEAGANANLPDGFGFTPLMRVLIGKAVNGSDVLKFLPELRSSMSSRSSSTLQLSIGESQTFTMCIETELSVSCIKYLISFGASLEAQDAFGRSALHIACIFGHSALLHFLAPNGDFHHMLTKDSSGCTPLFYLYNLGHCEYSRNILSEFPTSLQNTPNGTVPTHLTAVDEEGQTLLHYACRKGYTFLTRGLLEAGADPTVQDNQGNTPLHYVCERGNIYYLNHFIRNYSDSHTLWQITNNSGVTPLSMQVVGTGKTMLHLACEKQDVNLVRKFLEFGADPNATDTSGFTPLMRVITMKSITDDETNAIVTILCEFNCNVTLTLSELTLSKNISESIQIWEGTALHMAAKVGRKPVCVQTLTTKCTNAVDTKDARGRIPLHIATLYGRHNLINFLAPHPEYFLVKDSSGCTPLYYACKDGNYRCIHIYQQIADDVILEQCIQVANNDGITPLTVKDAKGRTILHHALLEGDGNLACKLLRAGADPTVKDHLGSTPLTLRLKSENKSIKNRTLLHHLCCEEGNFEVMVELLQAGADANLKDGNGYTPLMLALRYINDNCASRILHAFCDFQHEISNCVNSSSLHISILHIAAEYNKAKCVELLIAKGADLLVKNSNGKNPLHIACMKGHSNLVAYLLNRSVHRS